MEHIDGIEPSSPDYETGIIAIIRYVLECGAWRDLHLIALTATPFPSFRIEYGPHYLYMLQAP